MYVHETQIRVRYAETDQMGYVYYGNYAMYFEVGRVEALRALGFSYKQLEEEGYMLPVLDSRFKYLAPGKYDDHLKVIVKIPVKPSLKFYFEYEILNEQDELLTEGSTTLVCVNKETGKPCRPPAKLIDLFDNFY